VTGAGGEELGQVEKIQGSQGGFQHKDCNRIPVGQLVSGMAICWEVEHRESHRQVWGARRSILFSPAVLPTRT
jgi:hypothetical protein